jgi:hypothetical protein
MTENRCGILSKFLQRTPRNLSGRARPQQFRVMRRDWLRFYDQSQADLAGEVHYRLERLATDMRLVVESTN